QRYWPGVDPLGKRIKRGRPESKNPWLTVIGIVAASRQTSLKEGSQPEIYVTYLQNPGLTFTLVARTASDPRSLTGALRKDVLSADREIPAVNIKLMEELISNSVAKERLYVMMLALFAVLALIMARLRVCRV